MADADERTLHGEGLPREQMPHESSPAEDGAPRPHRRRASAPRPGDAQGDAGQAPLGPEEHQEAGETDGSDAPPPSRESTSRHRRRPGAPSAAPSGSDEARERSAPLPPTGGEDFREDDGMHVPPQAGVHRRRANAQRGLGSPGDEDEGPAPDARAPLPPSNEEHRRRGSASHEKKKRGGSLGDVLMVAWAVVIEAFEAVRRFVRALVKRVKQLLRPHGDGSAELFRNWSGEQRHGSSTPQTVRPAVFVLCACMLLVCAVHLGSYGLDYLRAVRRSGQAKENYEQTLQDTPQTTPQTTPLMTVAPRAAASAVPMSSHAASNGSLRARTQEAIAALSESVAFSVATDVAVDEEEQTAVATQDLPLPPRDYPLNPLLTISSRFAKLRRQNKDIVGFLSMSGILDEAVVQRDNSYYLRRDYLGYHNTNGAIFLDETCNLKTRPYSLILYGHNMKTGAMFGSLRNYEDIEFYHKNPFIDFDTVYEEGRYVIFSAATVSINPKSSAFTEFYALETCSAAKREEIIGKLASLSAHTCTVDVDVSDQLLLLVTCVKADDERRIIAARRLRDGETDGGLFSQVHQAKRK